MVHSRRNFEKVWRLVVDEYFQFAVFTLIALVVTIFTIKAYSTDSSAFKRYMGGIHPLVVLTILFIIGLVLFSFLTKDGEFAVYRKGNIKGILLATALGIPFALVMVFVDTKYPFSENMNVAYPNSIFFYPAIGYVVELLFHLLPFGLLYILLGRIFASPESQWIIGISILGAAIIEPLFQILFPGSQQLRGVLAYVGIHLLITNIIQLLLFVKYDFVSMYAFRLSYYLIWHIIWGYMRLGILF
jgi:hypothetical protein